MTPRTRDAQQPANVRHRRSLKAQERLERDRRQVQQAAQALEQALEDLGLPEELVLEIEGRLRSQKKLWSKIVGMMCPPLFGCRTNTELCRVRGWDENLPWRLSGRCPSAPGSSGSDAWRVAGGREWRAQGCRAASVRESTQHV
jgi:hypothetical protein